MISLIEMRCTLGDLMSEDEQEISVTLTAADLAELDRLAAKHAVSRSAVLHAMFEVADFRDVDEKTWAQADARSAFTGR